MRADNKKPQAVKPPSRLARFWDQVETRFLEAVANPWCSSAMTIVAEGAEGVGLRAAGADVATPAVQDVTITSCTATRLWALHKLRAKARAKEVVATGDTDIDTVATDVAAGVGIAGDVARTAIDAAAAHYLPTPVATEVVALGDRATGAVEDAANLVINDGAHAADEIRRVVTEHWPFPNREVERRASFHVVPKDSKPVAPRRGSISPNHRILPPLPHRDHSDGPHSAPPSPAIEAGDGTTNSHHPRDISKPHPLADLIRELFEKKKADAKPSEPVAPVLTEPVHANTGIADVFAKMEDAIERVVHGEPASPAIPPIQQAKIEPPKKGTYIGTAVWAAGTAMNTAREAVDAAAPIVGAVVVGGLLAARAAPLIALL